MCEFPSPATVELHGGDIANTREPDMWKRIVVAGLMAGGSTFFPAHAEDVWAFSYTGFNVTQLGVPTAFRPDASLSGLFGGTDDNRDGLLQLAELTRFQWAGTDYIGGRDLSMCAYSRCAATSFLYKIANGELEFAADRRYYDENGLYIYSGATESGDSYTSYLYDGERFQYFDSWDWTDRTRLQVALLPVPEPSMAVLSLAGLLLAGRLRRRQPK